MQITFEVKHIQHIESISLTLNLSEHKISCIVGKNGVGKTTLIKAIKNLSLADTFKKTSADSIFRPESKITYTVNDETYNFEYDETINSINCKKNIPDQIKTNIDVELPLPHGQRFNFLQTISDVDADLRRAVVLEQYTTPDELIAFLNEIYDSDKFKNIKAIQVKGIEYYCITLPNNRYIREDYLSSGEYFLISLYRKIKNRRKLIVIDEIDISLDAAAQVRLIKWLKACCTEFKVNILITTHSLAMMRTLESDELYYMQADGGSVNITPTSYNYIKGIMFGFTGWDKYILTEDDVLQDFVEYLIRTYLENTFYKYKIIYIGGAPNVADLLKRNLTENFFASDGNTIAVLDGDQRTLKIAAQKDTFCIPLESVEKALYADYQNGKFKSKLKEPIAPQHYKQLYKKHIQRKLISQDEIFKYLCDQNKQEIEAFCTILGSFLNTETKPQPADLPRQKNKFLFARALLQLADRLKRK